MSDLLSQNEIDALLHGVGDEEESPKLAADDYELYDLTSGMHRVKGWAHEIKIVDERFKTNLSIRLLGLLHKSVEVKREDIQILKYGEYVKSLHVPTSINTFSLTGMVGFSAIVLDAKLSVHISLQPEYRRRPTQDAWRHWRLVSRRALQGHPLTLSRP